MAKAHAAAAVGVLPDDLLLDIFEQLPGILDLIRCAGTCSRWFRLISSPDFLRRVSLLPENSRHRSFLFGAFVRSPGAISPGEPIMRKPHRPPSFYSLNKQPALTFTSFISNNDGLFNDAIPLMARRGLLLMRILPTPFDFRKLHLAVCHPLIGERSTHLVPPPPGLDLDTGSAGFGVTGHTVFTAADHCIHQDLDHPHKLAFQVLVTVVHAGDQLMYAYSYSSTTCSWSAPIHCPNTSGRFTMSAGGLTVCGPQAGVVARGSVHWLYRDMIDFSILTVSADATLVSFLKIPIQVSHHPTWVNPPFLCVIGEGKLSLVKQQDCGVLELWTKREQGDDDHSSHECEGQWTRFELMSKEAKGIRMLSFGERRGAMFVKQHEKQDLFTIDLDNKKMEPMMKVEGSRFCGEYYTYTWWNDINNVLYEMDWPSYLLHLSARNLGDRQ